MNRYLRELFARPNDAKLLSVIFVEIDSKYAFAKKPKLDKMPRPWRTVYDVEGAYGLVSNGGLRHLMQCDIADYRNIPVSHAEIGAEAVELAYRTAIAIFEEAGVLDNQTERVRLTHEQTVHDELEELSRVIWKHKQDLQKRLAQYVRLQPSAFNKLKPFAEDEEELKSKDLPTPPADAPDEVVQQWLDSIDASTTRLETYLRYEDPGVTLPECGNPILSISLSDERNSTDAELAQIAKLQVLSELRELTLERTYVSRSGLESLGGLFHLQSLVIGDTLIEDDDLPPAYKLSALRSLELNNTTITGRSLGMIGRLGSLEELNLCASDHIVDGWEHLRRAKLRKLNAVGLPIDEKSAAVIGTMDRLEELDLRYTQFTDDLIPKLAGCRRLEKLDLSDNNIDGSGFADVLFPRLRELSLWSTQVSDEAIPHFVKLPELRKLELGDTKLTNDCWERLATLRVEELSLTNNNFRDSHQICLLRQMTGSLKRLVLPVSLRPSLYVRQLGLELQDCEIKFW